MKRTMRTILLVLVFCSIVSNGRALLNPAGAHAASADQLSGMTLTQDDLDAAGMADYQIDQISLTLMSAEATAQEMINTDGLPEQLARYVSTDGGLDQCYRQTDVLKYPNDPVPAVYTARRVTTTVFAYLDEGSAEA